MKLKKITAFILTISIILSLFPATVSATSGTFTTADALTVLRAAAGLTTLTAEQKTRFDIVGEPTTAHALMILRVAAGLPAIANLTREQELEREQEIDNAVKEIMKLIPENASDFQKIYILHDWMINNVTHANHRGPADTAYSSLVEKEANRVGFTRGYQLLLNQAGIENRSILPPQTPPSWNLVKLDDEWYHVDSTNLDLRYFLVSDTVIRSSWRENYPWSRDYPATPNKSFITEERLNISFCNNLKFAGFKENNTLYLYNIETKERVTLLTDLNKGKTDKDGFGVNLAGCVFWIFHGDYIYYLNYYFSDVTNDILTVEHYIYNLKDGSKTKMTVSGNFDNLIHDNFIGVEKNNAYFAYFDNRNRTIPLTVFNMETNEQIKRNVTVDYTYQGISVSNGFAYAGSYNEKSYFYSDYDLFVYDTINNTFIKLERPNDIVVSNGTNNPQFFKSVEVVEMQGGTYLKWDIIWFELEEHIISGTRKIT
jgi:hypothetical protein